MYVIEKIQIQRYAYAIFRLIGVPGQNLATKFELISKYFPDEVVSGTRPSPAESDWIRGTAIL